MTERLARACARRPWLTVGAWLAVFMLAIVAIVLFLGSALSSEGELTVELESDRAYELIGESFPPDPDDDYVNELVLVRSAQLRVDDPEFRRGVESLLADIRSVEGIHNATSFYESQDRSLVSPDRRATLIPIGLGRNPEGEVEQVIALVEEADRGPLDVWITGEFTADRDVDLILDEDLKTGEFYFGIPAALLVLVLVFGALAAAVVPVAIAIVSITVALGLSAVLGQAMDLSVFLVNMLTVMGLAIGCDYALFVLSRFREERAEGRDKLDAIRVSGATASRAVLFSGIAFMLAMSGMLLIPDSILRSLSIGAISVALATVAAALTLLPAVLSLLGDRVNALRVPIVGRSAGESRFWRDAVERVMARPVVALVVTASLLLAAAAPVIDLRTSTPGVRALPDGVPSKEGFLALEESFGVGTVDPVLIVVDGDAGDPAVRSATEHLIRRLETDPRFREPEVEVSPGRDLAVVEVLPVGDSRDQRALDAVRDLRASVLPSTYADADAEALVTGETAEEIDYADLTSKWLPRILVFVLGLSFILLTIAFRSIVVALKAILLNLLSVGAAYGLLVLVCQKGVGNELFGFNDVEAITPWAPLFLFSVLFGLSMDYHVFLLSRIREAYVRTGDNTHAIVHGVSSTARVITGAALIIIVVFVGFASGDLAEVQHIGFGVGIALLLDATIVRLVLVPASMKLLGDWNWYLPSWLEWLPDLHVEGAERS